MEDDREKDAYRKDDVKLYPSEKIILICMGGLLICIPFALLIRYLAEGIFDLSLSVDSNIFSIPLFTSFVGAFVSLIRRGRLRKRKGDRRFVDILVNDFYFQDYATLSIISFVYGVTQGALLGGALGCSLVSLIGAFDGTGLIPTQYFLFCSLGCLILLFIFRVLLEGYTILYRTAQDFGAYIREKKD